MSSGLFWVPAWKSYLWQKAVVWIAARSFGDVNHTKEVEEKTRPGFSNWNDGCRSDFWISTLQRSKSENISNCAASAASL